MRTSSDIILSTARHSAMGLVGFGQFVLFFFQVERMEVFGGVGDLMPPVHGEIHNVARLEIDGVPDACLAEGSIDVTV